MKAVIMAGGEGKRLRPLTCTLPKPMARILGKPIIEYIFDCLLKNDVTGASVTLGYMPHIIENAYRSGYKNLKLDFFREDKPLGTAGSVKNAAAEFDEPFIVISGDALCNFDLKKITAYHKACGAMITVVAANADDPREYGLVKIDKENRVRGFIEKPTWSQALSNLANTGVYVVEPKCLDLIPKGKSFDFASDLFPLMLEKDMPIFCYHTSDYWCDVGNIEAYLKCQRDVFDGKMQRSMPLAAEEIYVKKDLPKGNYGIVPPVYIGENVEIADGAVVGPYAVADDNCFIGENAAVRYSVVLENGLLASKTKITGALVCSGAALKKGASMFENSVAGSGCVIGVDASVNPNILVWPGKIIGEGALVSSNLKYGSVESEFFDDDGISENCGARLENGLCVRLGSAVGTHIKKVGIASDGTKTAQMMKLAVVSGIIGAGGSIYDFGEAFEAQLNFSVNFFGLDFGIFIVGEEEAKIKICGEGGLPVTGKLKREIENSMRKCEFKAASENEMTEKADMSGTKQLYFQQLLKQAGAEIEGTEVSFECENEKIRSILLDCAASFGFNESEETVFKINKSGTELTAYCSDKIYSHETLLAVCCDYEIKNGKSVAVPYDSPAYFDELSDNRRAKVYRYLSSPADNADENARKLATEQIYVRDALFLAIRLLSIMKEKNQKLGFLVSLLPQKTVFKKTVSIGFSASELSSIFGENKARSKNDYEGISLIKPKGKLLIIPKRNGKAVRILAQADTMEAAQELCADVEELLESAFE